MEFEFTNNKVMGTAGTSNKRDICSHTFFPDTPHDVLHPKGAVRLFHMLIRRGGGGWCFLILFPFYMKANMNMQGMRSTQGTEDTSKQNNYYK